MESLQNPDFGLLNAFESCEVKGLWMELPSYALLLKWAEPNISDLEKSQLGERISEKRKIEFLSIRFLKNQFFKGEDILYQKSGKPFFEQSKWKIGISHSSEIALWCFSARHFGCDIEAYNPRILKVKDRFCSSKELDVLKLDSDLEKLTCLWSCKEAIYKLVDTPGINWKNDMNCIAHIDDGIVFKVNFGQTSKTIRCSILPYSNHIISIATYA